MRRPPGGSGGRRADESMRSGKANSIAAGLYKEMI